MKTKTYYLFGVFFVIECLKWVGIFYLMNILQISEKWVGLYWQSMYTFGLHVYNTGPKTNVLELNLEP